MDEKRTVYIPPYFVVGWTVTVNQNRYTKCYINTYPFGDLGEVGSESSGGPLRKNEKSKAIVLDTYGQGRASSSRDSSAQHGGRREEGSTRAARSDHRQTFYLAPSKCERYPAAALRHPLTLLFLTVMGLDTLDPPRRRDLSFFLVALLVVAPLRLVAPLSWIFVVYSLYTGFIWSFTWRGNLFFAFALCEVCIPLYFDVSEASITTQTRCNHLGGLSSAVMLLGGYNQSVWLCWLPTTSQHR